VVMLVDHYVGGFCILLHYIFDILCKAMSLFSLDYCVFGWVGVFFMEEVFVLEVVLHCFCCYYAWFVFVLFFYFCSIADDVYVNMLEGGLLDDWGDWVIDYLGTWVGFNWTGCYDDW
jgi:hypothetical protein